MALTVRDFVCDAATAVISTTGSRANAHKAATASPTTLKLGRNALSEFKVGQRVNVEFLNIAGFGPGWLPGVVIGVERDGSVYVEIQMQYGRKHEISQIEENVLPERLVQKQIPHDPEDQGWRYFHTWRHEDGVTGE